ncbi:uncharacterized protein LOC126900284 isoform X2 [Daktulosphaira vitifoliae]|uniref:uncharacterized protein LOC126900284 isoform X2 n=1 Tax=Daktulosphaira vitifoliae TaxID=58002 RepID=UPI0021AA087D|nr:uncharacterized protein LOC126900284 isoform X2 [Daktulosphaira vitifoliae]
MTDPDLGPKASSTAFRPQRFRSLQRFNNIDSVNDSFGSMYSNELTSNDLIKKTFSEESSNKMSKQMDSMLSGQSSLGILELDNMSDIIQDLKKKEDLSSIETKHPIIQQRQSQARLSLARASSAANNFGNDKILRPTSSNITNVNVFEDMLSYGINNFSSSFSSVDFIPGSEFKENLAEIEEVNRKEFGSLSESRFNFSLEGERQSFENKSLAAKYFATKCVPIEDLSTIFPSKKNINKTFLKKSQENKNLSFKKIDNSQSLKEPESLSHKTMSSITSWTDSHVSNNLMNMTSLSEISEMLYQNSDPEKSKNFAKMLLSGAFSKLKNFDSPKKNITKLENNFTNSQFKNHYNVDSPKIISCDIAENLIEKNSSDVNYTHNLKQCTTNNDVQYSENTTMFCSSALFIRDHKNTTREGGYFTLTSVEGFFENCTSENNLIINPVDLSKYIILNNEKQNVNDSLNLNMSPNISKVVYCNEALSQDKCNQSNSQNSDSFKALDIGDVCIGTYSQAVITLENRLNKNTKFTLYLLEVVLNHANTDYFFENDNVSPKTAIVLCSKKSINISSLSEAKIIIGIIPLVVGNINVYIRLMSEDTSQEINRKITVQSVEPQISWLNNYCGSIDFGVLLEESKKSEPIELVNVGNYQVPIKLILNQEDSSDIIQIKAVIKPTELWKCNVNFITSILPYDTIKKSIAGRLRITLDSVEELMTTYSPLLYSSNLCGSIIQTSIIFDQNPLVLKKQGSSLMGGIVEVKNNSLQPISLFIKLKHEKCSLLTISPNKLQLEENEKAKVNIYCQLSSKLYGFNDEEIVFQVLSSKKQFNLHVNAQINDSKFDMADLQSNTLSSRPMSPWSTTSSSAAIGQLELESTSSNLVWGSVTPNTKSVQTFTLRNRGTHKEKLRLFIKDNKNCFKFINTGENQVSEMKLLLEPMESQKVSVVLISTSNEGEAYGQIVLQRQCNVNDKKVISLYGYCGYSDIIIQGVFEDNIGHMWLYPNAQLMSAKFTVINSGNTTAFVKIIPENSTEDIIQPNEFILKKSQKIIVNISVNMTPERLEILLDQDNNSKFLNINNLSLIYGDEVTRVRVSRIWQAIKKGNQIPVYPSKQRLNDVSSMFNNVYFVDVNHVADSEKALFKLWKTGINEINIGVLMEKNNLESLLCETTTVFNDLETTVINKLEI